MEDGVSALQQAIAALEAQRPAIDAATLDAALRPLRERLAQLQHQGGQQLRQVSVLFVDVAGSTALARQLAPEDVHEVMDGALRRFTACVQGHGGRVLQYAGDSLLAAFGTPVAREDDAERAVQAALAVLAEAATQAVAVRERLPGAGDGFAVRAGIATGPVLLGGGVEGEASIRGAVVNLAARMEQSAPPGGLRICADTRRLVRGLFELDAQPPLPVKGYAEPVATWLVRHALAAPSAQATRGVGGVHAPLVGRADELLALQQAFNGRRRPAGDAPAVVLLLGEAGLGKTRLAAEFRSWTRQQPGGVVWLEAHASERGAGEPYGLLRQLLMQHLGVRASDSPTAARATWLRAAEPLLAQPGHAAVLGHLLGLDFAAHDEVRPLLAEGRQLRDRGFFHAAQMLSRIAAGSGPLALFLDDLQWADPGTLEFIDYAEREVAGLLMLLCSARPQLDEQRPGWSKRPGRRRVELAPLSGSDADALAGALLARLQGDDAEALRLRVIEGAEGNPFYMEELVNMLIDRGAIVEHDGGWRVGEAARAAAAIPTTLAGVLQARLDELPATQARAAQLAAVVGPVFWADALRALGLADEEALPALVQRQFIVPRQPPSLAGQQEFAFRHHLLHQVCYERVLRRVKVPAHAQVAQWLAEQPGERPLDLIAEHHERGGQRELAADAWQRAAEAASARYANEQALAHAQRALQLMPADALERRYALVFLRVDAMGVRADDARLEAELSALEALAEQLDDGRQARVALRRAVHLERRGHIEESLRLAESVWHRVATGWPQVAAHAGRGIAAALTRLGRTAEARPWAQAALGLAREVGDTAVEGALLNELAGLSSQDGDPDQAVALYEQALACHRAVGHRVHEAGVLSNLGYVDLRLGSYAQAAARFAEARTLAGGVGQRGLEGMILINLALATCHDGRPAEALAHAEAARALLQAAGNRWAEAAALRVMGQCELAQGRPAPAAAWLADAQARFQALKLGALAIEAAALLAEARLAEGRREDAAALADAVLAALDGGLSIEGCEEPMRVHLSCWRVLRALGDTRAEARLKAAQAQLLDRASRVRDPAQRERFLRRVPDHRALLQAG